MLTRPVSGGGPRSLRAGVADGQEDGLPAAGGVAPVVRLQDERALGAVSDHEAVHHVMELAAKTTALIDVAHQLPRLAAVRRVLEGGQEGTRTLLLDLHRLLLKATIRNVRTSMNCQQKELRLMIILSI